LIVIVTPLQWMQGHFYANISGDSDYKFSLTNKKKFNNEYI